MGKRTRNKTEDEIKKKIQRLEKELRTRQKIPPDNNYENEDPEHDSRSEAYGDVEDIGHGAYASGDSIYDEEPLAPGPVTVEAEIHAIRDPDLEVVLPTQANKCAESARLNSVVVEVSPNSTQLQDKDETVPSEILAVLGETKNSEQSLGKKIPLEVSERWGKILMEGLAKEQKASLLTNTLIPENFQLAQAPKLNPEVSSVLNDSAKNRDKRLEKMQNQLGSGIAGLANLTSELISKDLNKVEIIKNISEVNQILLDLHYEETMNRRRLIIPMLDKSFINVIQGVKRDKLLFGDNLGENIKTTKSIERSSHQIKKPPTTQPSIQSRRPTFQSGNFRAPPRQAGGLGATRTPPAPPRYYQVPGPRAATRPPPQTARRAPPPPPRAASHAQDRRTRR